MTTGVTDKLSLEDIAAILSRKENFPITWQLAKQLADTMRELENLKNKPAYEVMVEVIKEKETLKRENERLRKALSGDLPILASDYEQTIEMLQRENERLQTCLEGRDRFIVYNNLWDKFVNELRNKLLVYKDSAE